METKVPYICQLLYNVDEIVRKYCERVKKNVVTTQKRSLEQNGFCGKGHGNDIFNVKINIGRLILRQITLDTRRTDLISTTLV